MRPDLRLRLRPTDALPLRGSLGSLENLHLRNIFSGHGRCGRFQACAGQRAQSHNRVLGTKATKQGAATTVWPVWDPSVRVCARQRKRSPVSVILMASLPAKFADFPARCCRVGVQAGDIFTVTAALHYCIGAFTWIYAHNQIKSA